MSEVHGLGNLIFRATKNGVEIERELNAMQTEWIGTWDWPRVLALAKMAPPAPKAETST